MSAGQLKTGEKLPQKGKTLIMNPALANRGEQIMILLQGMRPLVKYALRKLEDGKISLKFYVFGVGLGEEGMVQSKKQKTCFTFSQLDFKRRDGRCYCQFKKFV